MGRRRDQFGSHTLCRVDDAELAWGAAAGDRAAWAEIYDRYADRLHDYCYSILRDRQESADALHEAFLTAATQIAQLRHQERLRPWLYAICRTQALAMVPHRSREMPNDDAADRTQQPAAGSAYSEDEAQSRLVWDAVGELAPKDRAMLDLYLRHGMDGQELGEVLDVKPHQATLQLSRVREHAERSLSALLVSRARRRDCAYLNGLLVDWDGNPTPLLPKRVVRHIEGCGVCGEWSKRMANPLALLSRAPLLPAPPELREPVLDGVELRSSNQLYAAAGADESAAGAEYGDPEGSESHTERRWPAVVAGVLVAMIAIGGLAFAVLKPEQPLAGPTTPAVSDSYGSSGSSGPAGSSSLASAVGSLPTMTVPTTTSTTSTASAQATSTRTTTTTSVPETSQPPQISNVSADQQISFREGSSCSTTEATARVTGQSSLTVMLVWQTASGGSNRTQMSSRPGNRFTSTIGPVEAINDGPIQWWVIATDSGGSSQSARQSVQVVATC
jgi:RNA polymerase sigma factor (sigma-70 family)